MAANSRSRSEVKIGFTNSGLAEQFHTTSGTEGSLLAFQNLVSNILQEPIGRYLLSEGHAALLRRTT
jgi:hypothetical protein